MLRSLRITRYGAVPSGLIALAVACPCAATAHGSSVQYDTIYLVRENDSKEKACRAGTPADHDDVQKAKERIEKTMAAYFALTPQSSPSDIRGLFTDNRKDIAWKFDGVSTPIGEIGAHLEPPPSKRVLIATVVGGDAQTARAIWETTPATGAGAQYYAGDFINEGWIGGWKIWHLSILPEPRKPDTPSAYCHFDPDQAF